MKPANVNLPRLRQILTDYFDEGELRTLSFDMRVDYDDLPGEGKTNRAREMVAYFDRCDRVSDLVEIGRQMRPNAPWDDVSNVDQRVGLGDIKEVVETDVRREEERKPGADSLENDRGEPKDGSIKRVWL